MKPTKYPIYCISKGRAESRLTSRTLEEIGIPYRIVIEPQEYDQYAAVIDPSKILVLPFSNLGQGSIPARNWVWEHSISEGHEKHWILDDNIRYFYRINRNTKLRVKSSAPLLVCEDFTDRFENVKISGLNYDYFVPSNAKKSPYTKNTRIYSCILIDNSVTHRWRGKYNEDTDLSIRVLKDGHCTILLNTFACGKVPTLTMKGGNTAHVYIDGDNRYAFAKSLYDQHPDIVEVTQKFGRWHHTVNYSGFANNKFILKENLDIPKTPNEYGLRLVRIDENSIPQEFVDISSIACVFE